MSQTFNPYLPATEYIPDGEPYVFGDRVYLYGSHDRFNAPIILYGKIMFAGQHPLPIFPIGDTRVWSIIKIRIQRTDGGFICSLHRMLRSERTADITCIMPLILWGS